MQKNHFSSLKKLKKYRNAQLWVRAVGLGLSVSEVDSWIATRPTDYDYAGKDDFYNS